MNARTILTICAIAYAALMPTAAAQGPPSFGIEGLTVTASPAEVTITAGESSQVAVHAANTGDAALTLNATAMAFPGGAGPGGGGFPGGGRPSGDRPTAPPSGRPPGNFTPPPGGFQGGFPTVDGLTVSVSPASSQVSPGGSADFVVSITTTQALAAGDYRIMILLDAGEAGRAMQPVTLHIPSGASKPAPMPQLATGLVIVLLCAIASRTN